MSDFLKADIGELMDTDLNPPEEKEDINEALARYDRELMRFKPNVRHKQEWPTPIRKRVCTK